MENYCGDFMAFRLEFFEAERKDPKNSPLKINGWKMKSPLERPGLFSGPMLPLQAAMGHWPTHLLVRSIGVPTCIASSRVGQMTSSGLFGIQNTGSCQKNQIKNRVVSSIILLMEEILHLAYSI